MQIYVLREREREREFEFGEIVVEYQINSTNHKVFTELFLSIEQTQMFRLSSYQIVTVKYSWFLSGQIMEGLSNEKRIYIYKKSLRMMKLASKTECASENFSLAMMYYKNYQHEQ